RALDAFSNGRGRPAADRACAAIDEFKQWLTTDAGSAGCDRYAVGADVLDLLIERGHWCWDARTDLAASTRAALDDALASLDRRARAAASGGWPEVQERLAARHPSTAGYLAAFQQAWNDGRAAA